MALFQPDAPWPTVARATSVFKLYPYFVGRASDRDLLTMFQYLGDRSIALALEARVLSRAQGCGPMPGDGGEATQHLLERILNLGGKLQYLAMDEPLKHALDGEPSCRAGLAVAADDVAENIGRYRDIFPDLQIGDIEPIGDWPNGPTLLADTLAWIDIYRRRTGETLAFVHADVGWTTSWLPNTTALAAALADSHVPFGIIYNGEDLAGSDDEWATQAIKHFQTFEDGNRPAPQAAVFQSWRPHPGNVLPETDPATLTGIVKVYIESRHLEAP